MYVRAVRFTDVSTERLEQLLTRIREAGGPPPGVNSTHIDVLFDDAQGSVLVLQHYSSKENMDAAAKIFDAMETSETPGTRASVDACEVRLELDA